MFQTVVRQYIYHLGSMISFPRARAQVTRPEIEASFLKFATMHRVTREEAQAHLLRARELQRVIDLSEHQAEAIVETGGTALCVETEDGLVPGLKVAQLIELPSDDYYTLDGTGRPVKTIIGRKGSDFHFGDPIDSSDFNMYRAARLAKVIYNFMLQPEVSRIIVVMGTDTMAYVASLVAQMIGLPTVPVIFTGSMEAPLELGSDAGPNIHRARFAANIMDPGVYLDIGNRIIDARRASKVHTSHRDAFRSIGALDVARHEMIEDEGRMRIALRLLRPRWHEIKEYHLRRREVEIMGRDSSLVRDTGLDLSALRQPALEELAELNLDGIPALKAQGRIPPLKDVPVFIQPKIDHRFDNKIVREHFFRGYKFEWLEALLNNPSLHGIILSGIEELEPSEFTRLTQLVREHSAKKPIILFRDPSGHESREIQANMEALADAGAISSAQMTIEWSTVLLKRLLAQTNSVDDIRALWVDGEKTGVAPYLLDPGSQSESAPNTSVNAHSRSRIVHNLRYIPLTFGHEPDLLDAALSAPGIEGVVLAGFGAGNLPQQLLQVVEKHAARIPVVMTSLCPAGEVNTEIYGPGVSATRAGILSGGLLTWQEAMQELDQILSSEKTLSGIKLLWALAKKRGTR